MACITMITDFGLQDEFVGVMKGVILGIDPEATIVDVNHGISPQDITEAAYALQSAFRYFPKGSIHLAVVDPGVGTDRSIIAVEHAGYIFLAPNNGLLWPIIGGSLRHPVYRVENRRLFLPRVCRTFHGRDIFAPVAGYLSAGGDLKALGPVLPFEEVEPLQGGLMRLTGTREIEGVVVAVDRFGNLVTNIHQASLEALDKGNLVIYLDRHRIDLWAETYAAGKQGDPIAVLGSRDCLEIAVNRGRADQVLGVGRGSSIRVRVAES